MIISGYVTFLQQPIHQRSTIIRTTLAAFFGTRRPNTLECSYDYGRSLCVIASNSFYRAESPPRRTDSRLGGRRAPSIHFSKAGHRQTISVVLTTDANIKGKTSVKGGSER